MRFELLYNPRLLCERLAEMSLERRRLRSLKGTAAGRLKKGHVDSLELLELLRVKPPRVIYDIGANVGTWTLLAKSVFPAAEVHAFEPLGRLADGLVANTGGIASVYRHAVALGTRPSESIMRLTSFVDASSLLELTEASARHYDLRPAGEETVRVERLDDYIRQHALPLPSLLKLDVQGYELEVLRGAERCLETVDAVLSEVSFVEFYRGQCMFHDVVNYLANQNFHLAALSKNTPLGRPLLQTDALFVAEATWSQLRS
jgi:FkbM family methyltransferase